MSWYSKVAVAQCILCVAVSSGCHQAAGRALEQAFVDGVWNYTFDEEQVGGLPRDWQVTETNGIGSLAKWSIEEASSSKPQSKVFSLAETKNSGRTFNLALAPQRFPADLAMSVRLRAGSGREDQGGGVVWRARDADNYYIARWNPLENNLRAYKVVAGRRSMLSTIDLEVSPDQWHRMEITATGSKIVVALDEKRYLSFEDETFAEGGRIGLWTKADAATSFDDLEVKTLGGY